MSEYNRSRERSRSPIRCYHTSRSEYRCGNDRDWNTHQPKYNLPSYSAYKPHKERELWVDEYYRKREPSYQSQVDSFKSRVYTNHIISSAYNYNKAEAIRTNRLEYDPKERERYSSSRAPKKSELQKLLENKSELPKRDDEYNPDTALRMTLQESKEVKSDFIDLTDDDDDVIFIADSRTSPPEVITIEDNEKDDGSINLMSVCRQLFVLEEYLKESNLEIRTLFNKALALERTNLNSSKSLLTNSNLMFLSSMMEKIKDEYVTGRIPNERVSFAKKLINDVIYLVENTEEIVEQVDEDVKMDVIEKDIEVSKESEQEVPSSMIIKEPEQTAEEIPKETPAKVERTAEETPKKVPAIEEQTADETTKEVPAIEEHSTSDLKHPVDISKYDNKRMKIAVDIGKALLASGKKVVTPEELDALVNVYLAVTADMSDSENDD